MFLQIKYYTIYYSKKLKKNKTQNTAIKKKITSNTYGEILFSITLLLLIMQRALSRSLDDIILSPPFRTSC